MINNALKAFKSVTYEPLQVLTLQTNAYYKDASEVNLNIVKAELDFMSTSMSTQYRDAAYDAIKNTNEVCFPDAIKLCATTKELSSWSYDLNKHSSQRRLHAKMWFYQNSNPPSLGALLPDTTYSGALGFGAAVDTCLYASQSEWSTECSAAVSDLHALRAQYYSAATDSAASYTTEEETTSSGPLPLEWLVAVDVAGALFGLAVARVTLEWLRRSLERKQQRREEVNGVLAALEGNPSLRAAVEAATGKPLPEPCRLQQRPAAPVGPPESAARRWVKSVCFALAVAATLASMLVAARKMHETSGERALSGPQMLALIGVYIVCVAAALLLQNTLLLLVGCLESPVAATLDEGVANSDAASGFYTPLRSAEMTEYPTATAPPFTGVSYVQGRVQPVAGAVYLPVTAAPAQSIHML
jgi:hypothetical protein